MKLCVCVSGQVRNKDVLFALADAVPAQAETRFVFSLWRQAGAKVDGPFRYPQRSRLFGPVMAKAFPYSWGFGALFGTFPGLKDMLLRADKVDAEEIGKVFPNAVVDIEEEDFYLDFDEKVFDRHSKRMLYKIWRANGIKRKLEAEAGERFEQVVRVRPDYEISNQGKALLQKPDEALYLPWYFPDGRAGDEACIGPSRAHDYYANLFLKAMESPFRPWGGIHRELYAHLEAGDTPVKTAPIGKILEGTLFRDKLMLCVNNAHEAGRDGEPINLLRMGDFLVRGKTDEFMALARKAGFKEAQCRMAAATMLAHHGARAGWHRETVSLMAYVVSQIKTRHLLTADRPYAEWFLAGVRELGIDPWADGSSEEIVAAAGVGRDSVIEMMGEKWSRTLPPLDREAFFERYDAMKKSQMFNPAVKKPAAD